MLRVATFPSHVETQSQKMKDLTLRRAHTVSDSNLLWPSLLKQNPSLAMESTTCHLSEQAEKLISCMLRPPVANFLFSAALKLFFKTLC